MTKNRKPPSRLEAEANSTANHTTVNLNPAHLIARLDEAAAARRITALKQKAAAIRQTIADHDRRDQLFNANGDGVRVRRDVLAAELEQVLQARTLERARYYLKRLARGVEERQTSAINDINLRRWKEYDEVITDSLWLEPKRDTAGAHAADYWGNFIPQIPRQLMLRYTKRHDWVLDCFLGSGTTLIECRRLGRNGVGVELSTEVARQTRARIRQESNPHGVRTEVVTGDARRVGLRRTLDRLHVEHVQMVILHPPYHDIIMFSDRADDLSAAQTTEEFLRMFGEVVDNATPLLERGRYLAVVIGDKYERGEWQPLGFRCMAEVLKRDYRLKSIVVKNFDETRAKRDQKQLWRYRALAGGFYVFKHEYLLLFQKK
ncbi:MAG TPA: DNA methyltransferase [Blastocatellia bacterium]|nr:DNA methyltransferase [Blastocatellia bacterium]